MKIRIKTNNAPEHDPRVGNVYLCKGGRALRYGHMFVLIAITKPLGCRGEDGQSCLMMRIDKEGDPVGCTSYAMHYVRRLQPIAFVKGLEALKFDMVSI